MQAARDARKSACSRTVCVSTEAGEASVTASWSRCHCPGQPEGYPLAGMDAIASRSHRFWLLQKREMVPVDQREPPDERHDRLEHGQGYGSVGFSVDYGHSLSNLAHELAAHTPEDDPVQGPGVDGQVWSSPALATAAGRSRANSGAAWRRSGRSMHETSQTTRARRGEHRLILWRGGARSITASACSRDS